MKHRRYLAALLILAVVAVTVVAYGQAKKETCPVCSLSIDKDPELSINYKGATYYFCLKRDMDIFKANPDKYAKKK